MIPDQKAMWEKKHGIGEHESFRGDPSKFAVLVAGKLGKGSKILELGCGVGRDAVFFAKNGHIVTATDLSDVVIERDEKLLGDRGIRFEALDMQRGLPFADDSFDLVFANLSLHYYTDEDTRNIIKNIARVLRPGGMLAFTCKSANDSHYGSGEEVEKDVFISDTGHVRHLFSTGYARNLVQDEFRIELLDEVDEMYAGEPAALVRCIARKATDISSK